MSNIIELTVGNFDEVLEQHTFLLIDFWAEWCAPCKAFAEIVKHVAPDYPEVTFGSLNIEEQSALADEFDVRSIPRVMILRNRTVIYDDAGVLSMESLRELLDSAKAVDTSIL
jgi:thioredoxin 1